MLITHEHDSTIGLDAARHVCKQAFGTPHLNLVLLSNGLEALGWAWEAVGCGGGLYVGVLGLAGENPDELRNEGRYVIAQVESARIDVLPLLVQATAMALESGHTRLT